VTSTLRTLRAEIELADLADDNGQLGNPKLELEDGLIPQFAGLVGDEALLYLWPPQVPLTYRAKAYLDGNIDRLDEWLAEWAPHRRGARGMLDAFVRIHTATDVHRFAMRFGVLGCCHHYLPSAHQNRGVVAFGDMCDEMQFPFSNGSPLHWEPISVWLNLAAGARSLLSVVAGIYQGRESDEADWERAITSVYQPLAPGLFSRFISPESQRATVCFVVDQWLALGGASHGLLWSTLSDVPELRLLVRNTGQPPTVAILASQLLLAVARASELAVCNGCTSIYRRQRRPQTGRRNYCQDCQASGLPNRDRQRARRVRLALSND
jgi:hypothetical protein